MEGGFASLGAALVGLGIIAIAGLVVAFGLVTLALSYRLEDARLMKVYDELRDVLAKPISS